MTGHGSLNHIYRTVWNQALGAMVAVAENTSAQGKASGASSSAAASIRLPYRPGSNLGALAAGIALGWGALVAPAAANPQGGVAVVGQISTATNGNTLTVTTQNGAGLNHSAINWQSFSIPAGSTTYFLQPNAASTSINRVVTNTPSLVFGTLGSNGNLVLVNQSGITVGAGAVVDTAGFTASALRMTDADALAGKMRFGDGTDPGAGVSVQGHILARSGDVVLLGPRVDTGVNALIQAPNGSAILAAGQQIELTGRGLEGIVMQVQAPANAAVNLGTLQGDAAGIFAGTLKHSGLIQAQGVSVEGGRVFLKALDQATVDGQITAQKVGGSGGTVNVQAATIDVQAAANISADAAGNADGGAVKILATGNTQFDGTITARGGAAGGNGGFVETSGAHLKIGDTARVNTSAALGLRGTWLLDPTDFSITPGGTADGSGDMAAATLNTNLGLGDVTIQSINGAQGIGGNVNVYADVTWIDSKLTLIAVGDVNINGILTATRVQGAVQPLLDIQFGQATATGAGSRINVTIGAGGGPAPAMVNLPAGTGNFSTKQGSSGSVIAYTVVNDVDALNALDMGNAGASGAYALGTDFTISTTPYSSNPQLPFNGIFNGLGHRIFGLTAQDGMFNTIGASGVVSNLKLEGAAVISSSQTSNVGILAGTNNGMIYNVSVAGNVAGYGNVGGMVGLNTAAGSIDSSTAYNVTVLGTPGFPTAAANWGGLVGLNSQGTISNSYAGGVLSDAVSGYGAVVSMGGLVGRMAGGTISDSVATGSVSRSFGSASDAVGGLVGYMANSTSAATVLRSSGNGSIPGVSGYANVGGLVGYNLDGTIVDGRASGPVFGFSNVGGLVGYNNGSISSTTSGTASQSYSNGTVTGQNSLGSDAIGGLVGYNDTNGTITNSYASGAVHGSSYNSSRVGGLVGANFGTISTSDATGSVSGWHKVGGLVGENSGSISSVTASGFVYGGLGDGSNFGQYIGGLVGYNINGSILASQANGDVIGVSNVGGLVGYSDGGTIINGHAAGNVTGDAGFGTDPVFNIGGLVGGMVNQGSISSSSATGNVNAVNSSNGSVGDYVGGLVGRFQGASIDNSTASGSVTGGNYVGGLVGSNSGLITASAAGGASVAVGGGRYVGGFVGINESGGVISGSTVSGGSVSGGNYVGGFFGANYGAITGSSATVASVLGTSGYGGWVGGFGGGNYGSLNGVTASVSGQVSGYGRVGGLVGFNSNYGTIDSAIVNGGGTVSGVIIVGGLVGNNDGAISGSSSNLNVVADSVSGTATGGLVGYNYGQINSSVATGNVVGANNVGGLVGNMAGPSASVANVYATGTVGGNSAVGGLIGNLTTGSVTLAFASGAVSGTDAVGGLVGANYGAISNSYATGAITGNGIGVGGLVGTNSSTGTIGKTYATGSVNNFSLATALGGLVGSDASTGGITNSFYLKDTNINATLFGVGSAGATDVAGVAPLTQASLSASANYIAAGWNASTVGGSGATWRIYEGRTGPLLTAFLTPLTLPSASTNYDGTTKTGLTATTPGLLGAPASGTNAGVYDNGYYSGQLGPGPNGFGYDITGGTLTINRQAIRVISLDGTRVYDGGNVVDASIFQLSGLLGTQTLTLTGSGTVADKNVGANKPVSLGTLALGDGSGLASNYTLVGGTFTATITAVPTVTWTGQSNNLWSNPANWSGGLAPDAANFATVVLPNTSSIVYDVAAGSTSVQNIVSNGLFTMQGGSLSVTTAFNAAQYLQTGGVVNGPGSFTVTNSFTQTGGSVAMTGPVSINQAVGDLVVGSVSGASVALKAPTGSITQTASSPLQPAGIQTAGLLSADSGNGVTLTDAGNAVSSFSATVSGAGNVAFTNKAVLDVTGITIPNGNLVLDNTGALTISGNVTANNGKQDITAHSPITINGNLISSGDITLAALTASAASNITVNGNMTSTGGGISAQAYNNYVQNAKLFAALGISVSAGGTITFGPTAFSVGNPINYTANGVAYTPPWVAATLTGGPTSFVADFLNQFQTALDAQLFAADDPLGKKQSSNEGVVVEGNICTP